jgi:S1-C subfamily serine protease
MAREEDDRDDDAPAVGPLHPDDRLWRHPSELAGAARPSPTWAVPAPAPPRRAAVAAMAGACLTGAALACGVLWLARPGWVAEPRAALPTTTAAPPVTTAVYAAAAVPTAQLATDLQPQLVEVEASVDGTWSTGTGVLLDGGTVLVAAPLVQGASMISTTGEDRRRSAARLLASDPMTSVAVLERAEGSPATSVRGPRGADARAGQAVAVVGARSTSGGLPDQRAVPTNVSATGVRTMVGGEVLHDAIELVRALPDDALGAAVVDAQGDLVGIVVATTGEDGLAVAVPADAALAVAADLVDDGEVRRAWLGVEATDLDPAAAALLELPGGAVLTQVDPASPAASAGLAAGDVIIGVGPAEVVDASDLVTAIRSGRPGERLQVRWQRGADEATAEVVLGG